MDFELLRRQAGGRPLTHVVLVLGSLLAQSRRTAADPAGDDDAIAAAIERQLGVAPIPLGHLAYGVEAPGGVDGLEAAISRALTGWEAPGLCLVLRAPREAGPAVRATPDPAPKQAIDDQDVAVAACESVAEEPDISPAADPEPAEVPPETPVRQESSAVAAETPEAAIDLAAEEIAANAPPNSDAEGAKPAADLEPLVARLDALLARLEAEPPRTRADAPLDDDTIVRIADALARALGNADHQQAEALAQAAAESAKARAALAAASQAEPGVVDALRGLGASLEAVRGSLVNAGERFGSALAAATADDGRTAAAEFAQRIEAAVREGRATMEAFLDLAAAMTRELDRAQSKPDRPSATAR